MDEVIYLEQDEEIPSVIDKLKNIDGKRVALVVPKEAAVLQSVVNLKILKLESEKLDKEISLVTQDKIGRNLASQVGLSVYDNIQSPRPIIQSARPEPSVDDTIELDMSEKKPIKPPSGVQVHHYFEEKAAPNPVDRNKLFDFKKPELQNNPDNSPVVFTPQSSTSAETRATAKPLSTEGFAIASVNRGKNPNKKKRTFKITVASIILIIAFALLYQYYPKATIILGMSSEPLEKDIAIVVDNNITKNLVDKSSIPGELQEVENEVKQTFNATGSKDVGEKATGSIKLTNPTGDVQTVETNSEFRSSSGLTFIATESVTVPKATASVDGLGNVIKVSGSTNIKVQAKEAGDSYNLAITSFTVIGNTRLTAESISSMSGGSSRKVTIVSQDNINNAKAELTNQAATKNLEDLKNKAKDQLINENSVTKEVISYSTNKNANDEVNSFEATIKLKSRTLSFFDKDYRQMITNVLNGQISADKELLLSANDEVTTSASNPDFSTGTMNLSSKVKTHVTSRINEQEIKSQIKGLNQSNANIKLEGINGISSVTIQFRPSWLKSIPRNLKNIVITKIVK